MNFQLEHALHVRSNAPAMQNLNPPPADSHRPPHTAIARKTGLR